MSPLLNCECLKAFCAIYACYRGQTALNSSETLLEHTDALNLYEVSGLFVTVQFCCHVALAFLI